MGLSRSLVSSKSELSGTPEWSFDRINGVCDSDLDAAVGLNSREVDRFLGAMEYGFLDSLRYDWASPLPYGCAAKVYPNPPYARGDGRFFKDAPLESRRDIEVVCLLASLTGSGRLDSKFQRVSRDEGDVAAASFPTGRLRFVKPDGATVPAPFDRVIVVCSRWPLGHSKLEVLRSLGMSWDQKAVA